MNVNITDGILSGVRNGTVRLIVEPFIIVLKKLIHRFGISLLATKLLIKSKLFVICIDKYAIM